MANWLIMLANSGNFSGNYIVTPPSLKEIWKGSMISGGLLKMYKPVFPVIESQPTYGM
jgi:hypothetical protein